MIFDSSGGFLGSRHSEDRGSEMLPWQPFFDFLSMGYTLAPPGEYDN